MRLTNWHVITGAPCSGKSAVICALERLGYQVVHEVARAFIDEELQKGKHIDQIKADIVSFERHILSTKLAIEKSLPDDALIFLDRGVPDSIGYYLSEGLPPDEPIQKSQLIRYKNIFFFERLKFEKDPVRSEDDKIASRLGHLLKTSYHMLGYDVIHVPALSVQERIDFVLNRL
ncbi:MAG: ATP-binding protein [Desulfobacterales bacterium]|uniref:ATP-binding protein n=1 Tax=Candidatus Desulfatibia profunda TaxID=2841695 RepID=A0A8J6NQ54_9BACT|nr:ATP-binding protein [Candidatus Desulfatibia profunda]MBL7181243.1 ATP-binding protein [Desulfobacterales bacterium]MBL7208376.1 ATP-binding protein [Desulfobacterales bacterium]